MTAATARGFRRRPLAWVCRLGPLAEDSAYILADFVACFAAIAELAEQAIVVGVGVANVGQYGQKHGVGIELSGSCSSADSAAGALARAICDLLGLGSWAAGVRGLDCGREAGRERVVQFVPLYGGSHALPHSKVGIRQALVLGLKQCIRLDEDALALVALAAARPLHHDCLQRGVLPGAARQRGIAAWQEIEGIEVSALQAQRPITLATKQTAASKIPMAFAALRVASNSEDDDFSFRGSGCH